MEIDIVKQLEQIKQLLLLSAKSALTMEDCALYTGLSKAVLYKKIQHKEIPYYKADKGKLTYFNKQEIEDWMLKNRVRTNAEVESEAVTRMITGNKLKKK